jgi:hypothetical protein
VYFDVTGEKDMTASLESLNPIATASMSQVADMACLQQTLALAGWTVDFVDIDLTGSSPMALAKCHRDDGRWFSARIDSLGRCSFETFQRLTWMGKPDNTKGRWPQSLQAEDEFLGRSKAANPRELVDQMAAYIVDNASGAANLPNVQQAWLAVMGSPTRLA